MSVERSELSVERSAKAHSPIRKLDYALLQQCIHCGMCLPTCPTYDATKVERNSPRGRIALVRAIADGRLEPTRIFGEEMYFCLGCLACGPGYRASGTQYLLRLLRLNRILPYRYRELERMTPAASTKFSGQLIKAVERPAGRIAHRVGMLTGCVQDIVFSGINRDTVDVLLVNGCEVHTPGVQYCCGSLHAHNGEIGAAKELARRQIDALEADGLDAIITNAAGCGSHLKSYGILLADDPQYSAKARAWSAKVRDIHEWLCQIGFRRPKNAGEGPGWEKRSITYHEACHLCHGQKITRQPREILSAIPGLELVELAESTWCCGSAGIYNITQPEMAAKLQERKIRHVAETGASIVATANPGCLLQLKSGVQKFSTRVTVQHPISLLA